MATKSEEKDKNEILFGLETARGALKERMSELRISVEKIEQELTAELDRLEKEHTHKQSEYTHKMSFLSDIRAGIEDQFKSGDFEDLKQSILSDTDKKIAALEREYPSHNVELVWDDRLCEQVKRIGSVVMSVGRREEKREDKLDNYLTDPIPTVVDTPVEKSADVLTDVTADRADYKLRQKPVTTVAIPGCQYPQGITYDYMDNAVYVLDNVSSKLYTYSIVSQKVQNAKFACFSISKKEVSSRQDDYAIILGPYVHLQRSDPFHTCSTNYDTSTRPSPQPNGIEFQNNTLYISVKYRSFVKQDFVATFLIKTQNKSKYVKGIQTITGCHGSEEGQMNTPTGVAFCEPNLYVCDSNNNRINVYSICCIIRTITHTFLHLPLDVKVHEKSIFVINSKSPYVLEFDLTGYLINEYLSDYGWDSNFMPSFFCIDSTGLFLITDKREPYVYVFNRLKYARQALETRLELEHGEDRLVEPRGVCLDGEGRVIVVCNYKDAMLQIF